MTEEGWIKGTVRRLWASDGPSMKEVEHHPYLVELANGRFIFAMYDDDECCQAPTENEMSFGELSINNLRQRVTFKDDSK